MTILLRAQNELAARVHGTTGCPTAAPAIISFRVLNYGLLIMLMRIRHRLTLAFVSKGDCLKSDMKWTFKKHWPLD